MEKNTGEIILHSRFRPLAGFMFLFPVRITPHPISLYTSGCGADGFFAVHRIRNTFKNRRIPHIRYNGADLLSFGKTIGILYRIHRQDAIKNKPPRHVRQGGLLFTG